MDKLKETAKFKLMAHRYRALFEQRDIDSSGTLSREEVEALLDEQGFTVQKRYLDHVFDVFDSDHSGDLNLIEFTAIWKMLHLHAVGAELDPEEQGEERDEFDANQYRKELTENDDPERAETLTEKLSTEMLFRKYDVHKRGWLSKVDVRNLLANENMTVKDEELFVDMWEAFDVDKSDTIDRKEFTALYRMIDTHHRRQPSFRDKLNQALHNCFVFLVLSAALALLIIMLAAATSCDTPLHTGERIKPQQPDSEAGPWIVHGMALQMQQCRRRQPADPS